MVSKVTLHIKKLFLVSVCACIALYACKENSKQKSVEKQRHIFGFDNNSYLIIKSFMESNYHEKKLYKLSDDSLISLIHCLYPKNKGEQINDTILLHTYYKQLDHICGGITHLSLWRNTNTPKIMSLNERASVDAFQKYFNENLKQCFTKNNINIYKLHIEIFVESYYCGIKNLFIKTVPKVDDDILNEFYRIVYTKPRWTLDKVLATKAEVDSNDYVRDKKLKINLEVLNNKINSVHYISDSISK